MNKEGNLYWITGLSGAGKTTIGTKLYNYLKEKKDNVVFLDGDILREVYLNKDYSQEGRRNLTYQHSRLCKMLTKQGIDVVICIIAMYEECREWNRQNIDNYTEIYLKVDIDELIRRDQKQLYSRALRNEIPDVMGINMDYEEPENPDIIIKNNGDDDPDTILKKIVELLQI